MYSQKVFSAKNFGACSINVKLARKNKLRKFSTKEKPRQKAWRSFDSSSNFEQPIAVATRRSVDSDSRLKARSYQIARESELVLELPIP